MRLLVDEGIVVFVAAREVFRRGVAANVAIDTRRVDVKRPANILFNFVVLIWQLSNEQSARAASRVRHLFRLHESIKLFARQKSELDGRRTQTDLLLVSVFRYLGGFVVSNMRIQRGNQH